MRKRAATDISSYDMLLDTVCNTFGGIVFIALLISIISGAAARHSAKPDSKASEDLVEIEQSIELEQLQQEQAELAAAQAHLEQTLASMAKAEPAEEAASADVSNETLRAKLAELQEKRDRLQEHLEHLNEALESADAEKAELEKKLPTLRDELEQKKAESTRQLRLPRLHEIKNKRYVFFAIKDGRLLAISDVSDKARLGLDRLFDKHDVLVESGPDMDVVELRKNVGQAITRGSEQKGKLAMALMNMDSKTEAPHFSVCTNSFAEFNYVKTLFVNRGFSYDWEPYLGGSVTIIRTAGPLKAQ